MVVLGAKFLVLGRCLVMKKIGKKGRAWQRARAKLIKEALVEGRIEIIDGVVEGICSDCGKWRPLTPDHRKKRSQGGPHDKKNIDWICFTCHNQRDNQGDPMGKKVKSKKADWAKSHKCKKCKGITSQYLCHLCGKVSV